MSQLRFNPIVVGAILSSYAFTSVAELDVAASNLTGALSQTMTTTGAYNINPDQPLPPGTSPDQLFAVTHPHNVVSALLSIVHKRNLLQQGASARVPAGIQTYTDAGWVEVGQLPLDGLLFGVDVNLPPAAPAPAPVAPAPAPAPVAPAPAPVAPAPVAPAPAVFDPSSLSQLVDNALAAPVAAVAAATPAPAPVAAPVAVAEPVDALPVAPQTTVATTTPIIDAAPVAAAAPVAPAAAPVAAAPTVSALPNASVAAGATGANGRPKISPFTKDVKPRNKVSDAPFWWPSMVVSGPKLFTDAPAEALDPGSDGSGPVQAYAALVELQRRVLAKVSGDITVAELRLFLDSVATDINAQPSAAAINQLVIKLFP